jgi:hypothetical protein
MISGSQVYELTEWGQELEPIVLALGGWGLRVPLPPAPTLSATSVLLFLRGCVNPDPADPAATYRLELDGRLWSVQTEAGEVRVRSGEPIDPDASLKTTPTTLNALLQDPAGFDDVLAAGRAFAAGDVSALRRLLHAATRPPTTLG